jgi:hypothetical protein
MTHPGYRRALALGTALTAALGIAAVASGEVQPQAGDYQGVIKGSTTQGGRNAGEGWFAETPTVVGKKMVPAKDQGYDAIIVPSIGPVEGVKKGCTKKPAALDKKAILLSKAQFSYAKKLPIGPHGRKLTLKTSGKWVDRGTVKGTTQISGGGCDTGKLRWTMTNPPPP